MKNVRILSAGSMAGLAGLMVLPISTKADPPPPQGTASASALSLTVKPSALLALTPQVEAIVTQLEHQLSSATGHNLNLTSDLKLSIDLANAQGDLTQALDNVTSGHANSTAVFLDYAPVTDLLNTLTSILNQSLAGLDTGAITGLLSTLSAQLNSVPVVGTTLSGLLQHGFDLSSVINVPGNTLNAFLNEAGHANVAVSKNSVINVSGPIHLDLAPYEAVAVDNALATANNVTGGGQLEADNTTTHLGINPTAALGGLNLPDLSGLLSTLTAALQSAVTTLQAQAGSTIQSVTGTLSGAITPAVNNAVTTLGLQGTPVGSALTTTVPQAVTSLVSSGGTVDQVIATIQGVLPKLDGLLSLVNGLLNNGLQLGDLISTDGVTSISKTHPITTSVGTAIESVASTSLADITVLPLDAGITNMLPAPLKGLLSGTSLLKVVGATSSASSALGNGAPAPAAANGLTEIDLLGHKIVGDGCAAPCIDLNKAFPQGTSITIGTSSIPALSALPIQLDVKITRGMPVTSVNGNDAKASSSDLDIQVLTHSGLPLLTQLLSGASAASASSGPETALVDLSIANAASEVSRTVEQPNTSAPTPPSSCTGTSCLPSTGMLGAAGGIAAGAFLGLLGLGLRFIPGARSRFRREA